MRLDDFDYELPDGRIARYPTRDRSGSRLLCLPRDAPLADRQMQELPALVGPGDLLITNDTRVIPARIAAHKPSGGRVEILLERTVDAQSALAQVRARKALRRGQELILGCGSAGPVVRVTGREADLYVLHTSGEDAWIELAERYGEVPLPPYLQRPPEALDRERYQTIFARNPGAVAAPTAGLHFDRGLVAQLRCRGAQFASVTLHVGAGSFQPVRCADIRRHRMHDERIEVSEQTTELVARTRQEGGRIIAVGTTSARALESVADPAGRMRPFRGTTNLYLYPGRGFKVVDVLITNFHLPRSSLLILVCALAGRERLLEAYHHAIGCGYRFYSYGDAMWIERGSGAADATAAHRAPLTGGCGP